MPDTGSLRGDLLALIEAQTGKLLDEVAPGLRAGRRSCATSPELAAVMRRDVIAAERARYERCSRGPVARGELPPRPASRPLLRRRRRLDRLRPRRPSPASPLDQAFVEELVDHVLLPILNTAPQGTPHMCLPTGRRRPRPQAARGRERRRARRDHVDPRHDRRQRRDQHARAGLPHARCSTIQWVVDRLHARAGHRHPADRLGAPTASAPSGST